MLTTEGRLLTEDAALGLRAEDEWKEAEKAQGKRRREVRAGCERILREKAVADRRTTAKRSKWLIAPYVAVAEYDISTDSLSTDSEASRKL